MRPLFFIYLLLFSCLAIFSTTVIAESIILPQQENDRIELNPHIQYFHDKDEIFHIISIVDEQDGLSWRKNVDSLSGIGFGAGIHWFSLAIENTSDQPIKRIIETEYPSLNVVDLYLQNRQSEEIDILYTDVGSKSAFANRPVNHRNILNEITIPANSSLTLIWRTESAPSTRFSATLWKPETLQYRDQSKQLMYGMIYGALFIMALYNLFLWASTKDFSYVHYVLYLLLSSYLLSAEQGHLYQYFLPEQVWPKNTIYTFIFALHSLVFAYFTISFLDLGKHSKRTRNGMWLLALLAAGTTILGAVLKDLNMLYLNLVFISLMYMGALFAGLRVRSNGVIPAGHFVIAIMLLILALVSNNMSQLGLIKQTSLTENLYPLGITAMLAFFSLALADRINQYRRENYESRNNLTRAINEKQQASTALEKSKIARNKLEQSASDARHESRAKSDFIAKIGMEIRPAVEQIQHSAGKLKSANLKIDEVSSVHLVNESSNKILKLINNLSEYASIEAGKSEIEYNEFNLASLIDDCISSFALISAEKDINFLSHVNPSIPNVLRGDSQKIKQILLNILSNAFKFTENGNVILLVDRSEKTAVNSIELKFTVKDSGIGITKQDQERLFSAFQHSYGSFGSRGLGLAISKQLIELMDGSISVESDIGKGTKFDFSLRVLNAKDYDQSLDREISKILEDKTALLCSNTQEGKKIFELSLSDFAINTTAIIDIEETIEWLSDNEHPDFILLDYDEFEGSKQVLKEIQEQQNQTPVVLMLNSQLNLGNSIHSSFEQPIIIIEKPITSRALHDTLVQAIKDPISAVQLDEMNSEKLASLRVLVAEDNAVSRKVVDAMLQHLNINADFVSDGLEAIHQFDKEHYHIILMDCEMPNMDGYEATKQIRAKEKLFNREKSHIVAISAHARSDHQSKAKHVGMDLYIAKPLTQLNIISLLKSLDFL